MTSFVKSALVTTDIETGKTLVQIDYVKYTNGIGYENKQDLLETTPIGTWTEIKSISDTLRYEQFLDTMVHKTTETRRKMALVELESVLCENNNTRSIVRTMNAIKILDPTFSPPVINMRCSWQKRFIKDICSQQMPEIISTCTSDLRLEKLFRVLQLIEAESLHQQYYS
jgi:hypothetical protein